MVICYAGIGNKYKIHLEKVLSLTINQISTGITLPLKIKIANGDPQSTDIKSQSFLRVILVVISLYAY